MSIYYQDERVTLYGGDALAVLASLPSGSVDAVITDPPYSSGGMVRGDRTGTDVKSKYSGSYGVQPDYVDFTGDSRDQRSYAYWCALWLAEALRVTRPGGLCLLFTDWRQLPATTDALQSELSAGDAMSARRSASKRFRPMYRHERRTVYILEA